MEKWSPDREKRKKEPARCICRKCYDAAVRRARAAAPPLPGVLNLAGMERCTTDIGRCSVCNLGKAAYRDQEADVNLCESCYARESRQQAEGQA